MVATKVSAATEWPANQSVGRHSEGHQALHRQLERPARTTPREHHLRIGFVGGVTVGGRAQGEFVMADSRVEIRLPNGVFHSLPHSGNAGVSTAFQRLWSVGYPFGWNLRPDSRA